MNLAVELARRGIQVRRHGSKRNEIRLCCPFCTMKGHRADTRFRFGLNLVTGKANCFNCGYHSARSGFILLMRKIGAAPNRDIQVSTVGFDLGEEEKPKKIRLPFGFEKLENVDDNDPLFG